VEKVFNKGVCQETTGAVEMLSRAKRVDFWGKSDFFLLSDETFFEILRLGL
jgi:hypothetical protein